MANNRMFIRCKCCGESLFIGSCLGSGYSLEAPINVNYADRLTDFFIKHAYCMKDKIERFPYDETIWPIEDGYECCEGEFEIVYEHGKIKNGKKYADFH